MTTDLEYVKDLFENSIKNSNNKYLITYDTNVYLYFIYGNLIILSHKFIDEFIVYQTNYTLNTFKFNNKKQLDIFLNKHIDKDVIEDMHEIINENRINIKSFLEENVSLIEKSKDQKLIDIIYNIYNNSESIGYHDYLYLHHYINKSSNKHTIDDGVAKAVEGGSGDSDKSLGDELESAMEETNQNLYNIVSHELFKTQDKRRTQQDKIKEYRNAQMTNRKKSRSKMKQKGDEKKKQRSKSKKKT